MWMMYMNNWTSLFLIIGYSNCWFSTFLRLTYYIRFVKSSLKIFKNLFLFLSISSIKSSNIGL
jgi:hypothetical protein